MKPSGEDGAAQAGGPWEECFEAAAQLALRAGQIIRKALSEEKRVSTKTSAADLVTETDHVVEALILQELQQRFPSHSLSQNSTKDRWHGTSLVVQWLKNPPATQGTRVQSLVREDPTCCGATKPVHHNY
uniref:Inositol monophosphatase 2 n=1 Tax=Balaenoptera musculus TaxID=9771 RepID=A0A8C0I572_BALMU